MRRMNALTKQLVKELLNADGVDMTAWVREPLLLNAIDELLEKEGEELTNHSSDRGGLTKWGLTEKKARELGYEGQMADITKDKAGIVAAYSFYFRPKFNRLADVVSTEFAFEVFEAGYLLGSRGVMKLVQRFLNVMNRQGEDWTDITVDGFVGEGETIPALKKALNRRGEALLLKNLRGVLYYHFFTLAENDPTQEDFFNGWVDRRINF